MWSMSEAFAALYISAAGLAVVRLVSLSFARSSDGSAGRLAAWGLALIAVILHLAVLRIGLERSTPPAAQWILLAEPAVAILWLWYLTRRVERRRA